MTKPIPAPKIEKRQKKNGNPQIRADLRDMKRLSKHEAHRLITHMLMMTPSQMNAHLQTENATGLEHVLGAIITRAMVEGDHHRLNFLFDRTIGRVPAVTLDDDEAREKQAQLEVISRDVLIAIAKGRYDEAIKVQHIDAESQPCALSSGDESPQSY